MGHENGSSFRLAGRVLAAATLLAALAGCPALQVQHVWQDDTYRGGRPQKVLVLCVMNVPTVKRSFENEFAMNLNAKGIKAVESFRVIPEGSVSESGGRDAMVALIKEQGFDAVLFTRAVAGRTEVRDVPGMTIVSGFGYPYGTAGGWGAYAGAAVTIGGPSTPTTQGYTHEQKYLTIETQLFDTRTEKCLWAAQSELRLNGQPQAHIRPYVVQITDRLAKAPAKEKDDLQKQLDDVAERRRTMLPQLEKLRDMARAGRKVRLPLMEREIPIILDDLADPFAQLEGAG